MKTLQKILVSLIAAAAAVSAWADPPGRVGRVSVQAGSVLVAHGGGEWRGVVNNYPVTDGDNIYVAPGGRAEIDFGSGMAWLDGGATVYFERLDDNQLRTRLAAGQMIVRVRELDRGETARIDTPRGGFDITTPGLFRVEAGAGRHHSHHDRGGDVLHVKYGAVELSSGGMFEPLRGGDAVEYDGRRLGHLNIRGEDAFGAWVDSRDLRFQNQRFAYVSPRMVGWRDLDDHGTWRDGGSYGWVWFPRRVAADWAPYRYGHWSFVSPWGWTWVDDAPWGFAPFHYGRWVSVNGRWAWAPGQFERRPVYAPALVAWQGDPGRSINVNVGNSMVYWTPLSWGEAYYPSYGVSASYWRTMNRPYVSQHVEYSVAPPRGVTYRNWSVNGGATAVEAAVIASARPVAPAVRAMPTRPLPTTQQMENFPVQDYIKPAYGGAPVIDANQPSRVMAQPSQPSQPMAAPNTQQVQEAGGAVMAQQPLYQAPPVQSMPMQGSSSRPTPLPLPMPANVLPSVPAIPVMPGRPTPSIAAPSLPALPPLPQMAPAPVVSQPVVPQANPRGAPMQFPQTQPQVQLQNQPQPVQGSSQVAPQVSAPAQPTIVEQRQIAPAQNRGEAKPVRPDTTYVEPYPKPPGVVVPQTQPVQERSKRGAPMEVQPDREKPQR